MYDSRSEIIKQHKTSVDDNFQYREYVVYKKDEVFITECIEWRIKSPNRQGGSQLECAEYKTEKEAVAKYDELLREWESK